MTSLCGWGFPAAALALVFTGGTSRAEDSWLDVAGGTGPGTGKRVVLVSGDEEYRSEEAAPRIQDAGLHTYLRTLDIRFARGNHGGGSDLVEHAG